LEEVLLKLNKEELLSIIKSLIIMKNINGEYDEDLDKLIEKLSEKAKEFNMTENFIAPHY
jgi:hypothetical protein